MFSRVLPNSLPQSVLAPWRAVLTAGFRKVYAAGQKTSKNSNKPLTEAVKPPPSTLRRNPQPPPFPSLGGQQG